MFVAIPDPGVRQLAVVLGANKCICDRFKVGRDRRSRPTLKRSQYAFIREQLPVVGQLGLELQQTVKPGTLSQQFTGLLHLTYLRHIEAIV